MNSSMVVDLGIGSEVWLCLTLLSCVTVFFKFRRLWSVRNLDLLLLFAPAPGVMALVGSGAEPPWIGFAWLFVTSLFWLARCLVDLGLARRPLLEPNLNAQGLACLATGLAALLVVEAISLPLAEGVARNPADSSEPIASAPNGLTPAIATTPAASTAVADRPDVVTWWSTQIILSRVLAGVSHLAVVVSLLVIGWRIFERPILGLAAATCYLLLPYTRIEVVDSGQAFPAALTLGAVIAYRIPAAAGGLLGLAAGTMPAAVGLIPLWAGFYWGRGSRWFLLVALGVIVVCAGIGQSSPEVALWARAMGARSLAEAGLLPWLETDRYQSLWSGVEPAYRLPVVVAYLGLVATTTIWPAGKNLGEVVSLSVALLIASQFWYLDRGGTHILLYMPLMLVMIFRPNLSRKVPDPVPSLRRRRRAELSETGAVGV